MFFLRTKIEPKSIGCFFCIYLNVFGPRIGGFFDLSVLTSGILLFFVLGIGKINLHTKKLATILFLVIIDIFLVSSLSGEEIDLLFLLKFIRVLLALLCISSYIELDVVKTEIVKSSLINVLLMHAIIIIVGSIFLPEIQNVLKPLSGFGRRPRYFRSTGLTNGYDFAGLLCLFGMLITFFSKTERLKMFKVIVFIVAAVLTSRVNMILTEIIIAYLLIFSNGEKKIRLVLGLLFILSLIPVLGIFLFTTGNQENFIVQVLLRNEFIANASTKLVYYYASSNVENTLSQHYNFNILTNTQILFGSMQSPKMDPGYTQYIYHIGVLGTGICLLFYVSIISNALKIRQANKEDSVIVICFCLMCIIMSVKNSYLLARHVTETLLIMSCLLNKEYNNVRNQQIIKRNSRL